MFPRDDELNHCLSRSARLREEGRADRALLEVRRFLAAHGLRNDWLERMAALTVTLAASHQPLPRVRVAVVGETTLTPIVHAIVTALLSEGRVAVPYEGLFGAGVQEILDADSALYRFKPELVVLIRDSRLIERPESPLADRQTVEGLLERLVDFEKQLWSRLRERSGCLVLPHLHPLPPFGFSGPGERTLPAAPERFLSELNQRLRRQAPDWVIPLDLEWLANRVGRESWWADKMYHFAKLAFDPRHLPDYAHLFLSAWRLAANRVRKCLVLDLDNTLWRGVIGDDGLEGIGLGPPTPTGEGHQAFCRYLRDLRQRGVVLAVCSRNDAEIAGQVFQRHPHMPLKRDDFAVFHCAWTDKVSGLRTIARQLNLGLDALVFVDDNPVEIAQVARELPEVASVHLQGDPGDFSRLLDRRQFFPSRHLTLADKHRADSYAALRRIEALRETGTDTDGFLDSLEMVGDLFSAGETDLDRLAQMEARTNQFNMTTARLSREELAGYLQRADGQLLGFRLRDRFADYGLVSLVTVTLDRDNALMRLDNWVMSCRVFSRTAEAFIFNGLFERVRALGLNGIEGRYIPSERNGVVRDLYRQSGFQRMGAGGPEIWHCPVTGDRPAPLPTRIRSGR